MQLFLAEKPEVAKHIANVLSSSPAKKYGYFDCGNERIVTWCIGHMLKLSDPEDFDSNLKKWDLDTLPMQWPVKYKPNESTSGQLKVLKRLMKSADTIVNCTDIDAAGQAIADNVFKYCHVRPETVKRALINDNHPNSIRKALKNLKPNTDFHNLYLEELARAVGDQRVGYNITRLLTCQARKQGYNQKLNSGRVQSAILGLVVRRTRQRKAHVATKYYNIDGYFDFPEGTLKGRFNHNEHAMLEVDEKNRISNLEQARLVGQKTTGKVGKITQFETKTTYDSPPLPYDLLSLQVDCSRYFGMSPDDVMRITQELRDAPFYAITYNRSDNRYIDESNFADAAKIFDNLRSIDVLSSLLDRTDTTIKSRAFDSSKVGAHGGICPTETASGWEEMSDEQQAVFLLITRNYLLQFMPKRERYIANYVIEVMGDNDTAYCFDGRVQTVTSPGWFAVFCNDTEADEAALEDVDELNIDGFLREAKSETSTVEVSEKTTTPPALYSMTTLLKDLKSTAKYIEDKKTREWMLEKDKGKEGESGGIGTAATRSSIVKELFNNALFEKNSKSKIIPTVKGEVLYDLLPKSITAPDTTAIWSHYFRQIGEGSMTPEAFWSEVDQFIESFVATTKSQGLNIPQHLLTPENPKSGARAASSQQQATVTDSCPKCAGTATRIKGKFGPFWECRDCKSKFSDKLGALFHEKCPQCRHELRIVKGKKVKQPFIGCTNHPQCNYTEELK